MAQPQAAASPVAWAADDSVTSCPLCNLSFGVLRRRHHCRNCGGVFCADCTCNKLLVEGCGPAPSKVCFGCYAKVRGVTDSEKRAAAAAVPEGDSPAMYAVLQAVSGKDRLEPVVVVTRFRVYFFRRDFFSGIEPPTASASASAATSAAMSTSQPTALFRGHRSYHLFDLLSISCESATSASFAFLAGQANSRSHSPSTGTVFVLRGAAVPEVVRAVRHAFQRIVPQASAMAELNVTGPEECLLPLDEFVPGPALGFADHYRAQCNYAGMRASDEVITHIEELAEEGTTILDLDKVPGIEPRTAYTVDILPLVATLFANTFFASITSSNIARSNLASVCCSVFAHNNRMAGLALRNMTDDVEELVVLGKALVANPMTNLQSIDLSGCLLSDNVVRSLSKGIAGMQRGLRRLNLAGCGMKPRTVATLVRVGLMANYPASCAIEDLDVSSNKVGDGVGCQAMCDWMTEMGAASHLERISVAGTSVDFSVFARGLNRLTRLRFVDFSSIPFDATATELVSTSCQLHRGLTGIRLSGCRISGAGAASLLGAVLSSRPIDCRLSIDLSGNELDDATFDLISAVIARETVSCLDELNLSGCSCTERGLGKFLGALLSKPDLSIRAFHFNNGTVRLSDDGVSALVGSLIEFLNRTPSLQTLSVSGGCPNVMLCGILRGLVTNTTLRELDISGNRIGEVGGRCLGNLIRRNKSILHIDCDGGIIPPHSWAFIASDTKYNDCLQSLTMPWGDYEAWSRVLSPVKLDEFRANLLFIQERCALNRNATVSKGMQLWQRHRSFGGSEQRSALPTTHDECPAVEVPESLRPGSGNPDQKKAKSVDTGAVNPQSPSASQPSTAAAAIAVDESPKSPVAKAPSPPAMPAPEPPKFPERSRSPAFPSPPPLDDVAAAATATASDAAAQEPPPPPPPPLPSREAVPKLVPSGNRQPDDLLSAIRGFKRDPSPKAPAQSAPPPSVTQMEPSSMGHILADALSKRRVAIKQDQHESQQLDEDASSQKWDD